MTSEGTTTPNIAGSVGCAKSRGTTDAPAPALARIPSAARKTSCGNAAVSSDAAAATERGAVEPNVPIGDANVEVNESL